MTPAARASADRRVAELVRATPEYQRCRRLLVYAALPDELPLSTLVARARDDGKCLLLPRMAGAHELVLARIERIEGLAPGRYGVREPPADAAIESLGSDVLALVPGLAFDSGGGRLGRGGGVWDRALCERSGALAFGVGFEFQIVDALPLEEHDQGMDGVVTETAIRRFARA